MLALDPDVWETVWVGQSVTSGSSKVWNDETTPEIRGYTHCIGVTVEYLGVANATADITIAHLNPYRAFWVTCPFVHGPATSNFIQRCNTSKGVKVQVDTGATQLVGLCFARKRGTHAR